eukprot:11996104-Heterocapsa_arctica.AAC.1
MHQAECRAALVESWTSSEGLNAATSIVIPLGEFRHWAVVEQAQGGVDDVYRSDRCGAGCGSLAEHGDW